MNYLPMETDTGEREKRLKRRDVRTVKWSRETDELAERLANEAGYTYKGRTHVNEFLAKLVHDEDRRQKLAAGKTLSEHEEALFETQKMLDSARNLKRKLNKNTHKEG